VYIIHENISKDMDKE